MIKVDFVSSGDFQVNCHLVYDDISKKAIIIDPGVDGKKVIDKIEKLQLVPELLINTHGHFDHMFSDDIIRQKYNISLAIHKDDLDMLSDSDKNFSLAMGNEITANSAEIIFDKDEEIRKTSFCEYKVIHTPGHSKGSVCILIDDILFAGDTIFKNSIGRTDLAGGNYNEIVTSIQKLKDILPKNIKICPGHGPFTTLENELKNNPYF